MGTQQLETSSSTGSSIIDLNVGGVFYTSSLSTLTKETDSLLARMFIISGTNQVVAIKDSKGKYFIDRDGVLFRYVLDYLRNGKIVLPENFHEKERLKSEAEYFQLPNMVKSIQVAGRRGGSRVSAIGGVTPNNYDGGGGTDGEGGNLENSLDALSTAGAPDLDMSRGQNGSITIGYRGTFAFGRDGLADVKFRKLTRILIAGRVSLCREVFGDTLNESRDPDRGGISDRYTSRYFLKHNFLEQAFDMLLEAGFRCVSGCASGTAGGPSTDAKAGQDSEENRWNHYNEFVFMRGP